MPELLEIEMYRRGAQSIVGRTISDVAAPDDWYLKGIDAHALTTAIRGATIETLARVGKVMLIETTAATLGLRFGMTGVLVIDGEPVIPELEYSSKRFDPGWDRFSLQFGDGGSLAMNDPRRLGGIELDPERAKLGPDAWSVSVEQLVEIFGRYRVATKALLLNQARVAGLGNLLVDELLWRAGVAPQRPANEVRKNDVRQIGVVLAPMLDELYQRGGSTFGDHFSERNETGCCPLDGTEMAHDTVGGRSTWWCPNHQR